MTLEFPRGRAGHWDEDALSLQTRPSFLPRGDFFFSLSLSLSKPFPWEKKCDLSGNRERIKGSRPLGQLRANLL
jgi:hypothetical protein